MKTVSGKISFVVLGIVAIVTVLRLGGFAMASGDKWKFSKSIGGPGKDDYAELKPGEQGKFDNALIKLKNNGGDYHIRFLCKAGGKPEEPYDPRHHQVCSIKTDKVTKSELADSSAVDASAANDPNAVYHLYSDSSDDIQAVVDTLK